MASSNDARTWRRADVPPSPSPSPDPDPDPNPNPNPTLTLTLTRVPGDAQMYLGGAGIERGACFAWGQGWG